MPIVRSVTRLVVVLAVAGVVLGACGRRGALEPPPDAPKPPPIAEGEVVKPGPRPTNPDRPFILDRLI